MNVWDKITTLQRQGTDAVVITITSTRGSVPGEVGAKAIVIAEGLVAGNLGGGKVEAKAITHAQEILRGGEKCCSEQWNLQRDVGMTCGGELVLLFERIIAQPPWHLAIFGAGHVSQALVPVLATLACRIDVFDVRPSWLARFPSLENVTLHHVSHFEDGVARLTQSSFVLAITQGHSTDRPVLRDTLKRFQSLPFIGAIGSASKRAVLLKGLKEDGIESGLLERIYCPLGLPIGSNDPAEIAISITAQLLSLRPRSL